MNGVSELVIDRKALPLTERTRLGRAAPALLAAAALSARMRGDELIVLDTCERFELYAARAVMFQWARSVEPDAVRTVENGGVLEGAGAARRIFRICAGLDSRLPGESEVLGQARAALRVARRAGLAGGRLDDLFQRAIRCGRTVRRETALGRVAETYAMRAVVRLRDELGLLRARRVGVVGAGSLARDVARRLLALEARDVTLIGRHAARTRQVAAEVGVNAMSLAKLAGCAWRFDALVSAVSCAEPVIRAQHLGEDGPRLLVDLGAAPNVDPAVEQRPGARVLRLDDLTPDGVPNRSAIDEASAIVDAAVARFLAGAERRREAREAEGGAAS